MMKTWPVLKKYKVRLFEAAQGLILSSVNQPGSDQELIAEPVQDFSDGVASRGTLHKRRTEAPSGQTAENDGRNDGSAAQKHSFRGSESYAQPFTRPKKLS